MFLFEKDEVWRQYMEELGIQATIDYLAAKGLPTEWPTRVIHPSEKCAVYLPEGKPGYKSTCPCYEGYHLLGGTGSVQCRTAGELLPGVVWYEVCSKGYCECPFYKDDGGNKDAAM